MRHVLAALEDYQRHRCPSLREHPLCGRPTLSVGLIEGGRGINTVADLCSVAIDRRILPNEFPMEAYQDVIDHVAKWPEIDFEVEHETPFSTGRALSDENNRLLSEHLLQAVRSVQSDRKVEGVQYGTNAGAIASSGVPCVVFGPGTIDQAHTKDEWLSIEQLHQACEILYRFGAGTG
jgi:acetylornithine deacetylase